MSLQIAVRSVGEVSIVDLGGMLRMGTESSELHKRVRQLVADGQRQIVFNCRGLEYVDSFGVGELVAALSTIKKHGGALRLAELGQFVRDVLRVTRLLTVFEVDATEADALARFRA
jgi:anti-anti-sigma factor